jgi:acetyltransferase-like isoleucine patch superfamily enzyme
VVFCRIPALEEVLRLVPGLYSQWLRLWGARIGRFTYWSAGTLITDRSFLSIGDYVVLGAGVRLNSHVLAPDSDGTVELLLASIKIGDRVMVGGYSLLTAGTEIASGENTRAFLISPPFSSWKAGKRVREERARDGLVL